MDDNTKFFKRKDVVYRVNGSAIAVTNSKSFVDIQKIPSDIDIKSLGESSEITEAEFNNTLKEVKETLQI